MLVDDHVFWRHGLRQIIDAEPDMKVIAEADNGEEAIRKVASAEPDIILMDLVMPVVDGVEATRQLISRAAKVKVLMLTMHDSEEVFQRSLRAGAAGRHRLGDAGFQQPPGQPRKNVVHTGVSSRPMLMNRWAFQIAP